MIMGRRRMFSPEIVESDRFLGMSMSAQCLYFHLGLEADDDGFVAPRKAMRIVGADDNDLKILGVKGFVIPFDESEVVVLTHWNANNHIRKDRYQPTTYVQEMRLLKS